MVDIDQYGIPIRMQESQHMPSDESTFWGGDNSDSLTTQPNTDTSPTHTDAGSHSTTTHGTKIYKQSGQAGKTTRTWPAAVVSSVDKMFAATDSSAEAANWMSSTACQQSSLTASLQCSASDLRLCLGLQQAPSSAATRLVNATLLPDDLHYQFSSQAELAQLTQSGGSSFESPCFFRGSPRGRLSFEESVLASQSTVSFISCRVVSSIFPEAFPGLNDYFATFCRVFLKDWMKEKVIKCSACLLRISRRVPTWAAACRTRGFSGLIYTMKRSA